MVLDARTFLVILLHVAAMNCSALNMFEHYSCVEPPRRGTHLIQFPSHGLKMMSLLLNGLELIMILGPLSYLYFGDYARKIVAGPIVLPFMYLLFTTIFLTGRRFIFMAFLRRFSCQCSLIIQPSGF
jgi:hypothetical protein